MRDEEAYTRAVLAILQGTEPDAIIEYLLSPDEHKPIADSKVCKECGHRKVEDKN